MFKRVSALFVLFLFGTVAAQSDVWKFDKAHSTVGFSVRHMVISKTKGHFHDFDGHVKWDGKNFDKAQVEAIIQIASIDTENEDRDKHLKSDDFFNAEKFPVMKFQSKSVSKVKDNKFTMVGDLTIRDVTREVTLDCEFHGTVNDPWGNMRTGFSAAATINRQDFDVRFDNKLADGSLVVGNDVSIVLEIELIAQK